MVVGLCGEVARFVLQATRVLPALHVPDGVPLLSGGADARVGG